jgi:hypothetical protein
MLKNTGNGPAADEPVMAPRLEGASGPPEMMKMWVNIRVAQDHPES